MFTTQPSPTPYKGTVKVRKPVTVELVASGFVQKKSH